MAGSIPSQKRAVDPFASYNSNTVNVLLESIDFGENGLITPRSLFVVSDTTSPLSAVVVNPGFLIKDNVLIRILNSHRVDFTDNANWETGLPDMTFTGGYCYIVLKYRYLKQRPAPQAEIKILKPAERSLVDGDSDYFYLGTVHLDSAPPHNITGIFEIDPENPDRKRKYVKTYAGAVYGLPPFDIDRDLGRIMFDMMTNQVYFGTLGGWSAGSSTGTQLDLSLDATSPIQLGDVCYINSSGNVDLATTISPQSSADFVINQKDQFGTKGLISGIASVVRVEPSITISPGDKLYLSNNTPGRVTNVQTAPFYQYLGRALTAGDSTSPIIAIFNPGPVLENTISTRLVGQISSWTVNPSDPGDFYSDIDVSALGGNAYISAWFDNATNAQITPKEVELISGGTILRVHLSTGSLVVNYVIQN